MAVAQSGSAGLELPENVVVSRLDELASWCRKNSLWPMPFATACCGIELMATGAAKHDLARFGAEVFRFSPRQCDLMMMMMMMMMMIMMMMIMMMMTTTMMMMTMSSLPAFGCLCHICFPGQVYNNHTRVILFLGQYFQ